MPKHLGRLLDTEPWRHGEEHPQLPAGQAMELGESLARKEWHDDRVLHEDRGRRGKGTT